MEPGSICPRPPVYSALYLFIQSIDKKSKLGSTEQLQQGWASLGWATTPLFTSFDAQQDLVSLQSTCRKDKNEIYGLYLFPLVPIGAGSPGKSLSQALLLIPLECSARWWQHTQPWCFVGLPDVVCRVSRRHRDVKSSLASVWVSSQGKDEGVSSTILLKRPLIQSQTRPHL